MVCKAPSMLFVTLLTNVIDQHNFGIGRNVLLVSQLWVIYRQDLMVA